MTDRVGAAAARERLTRWALPVATLVFFVATARGYGIFRDELYYIACGKHLAWGYVDQPPFVALIAWVAHALFGDSLVGLRLFPSLAAAGTVLLVGDTAGSLGGGRFARLVAQLLAATAPIYLGLFTIFSMNAFDVLIWAGLARLAAALLAGADPRLWIGFGALAGLGLENKVDVGLLGAGLAAGILLSRRFELLRSRWLWLGGALAGLLFLPHVLWQASHGWPTREFVAHAQAGKITVLGPLGFLAGQIGSVGPVAALAALSGLAWLLLAREARSARALGWAAIVVLAIFAFSISKSYYYAPAYTILFPAAGVALESWSSGRFERPARALALLLIASALLFAPLAKPLLSEDAYVRYAATLGMHSSADENHRLGRLPQFFADMHGWRAMVEEVAAVYRSLPPAERAEACIYANNYGEAGAVDFFGPALGLPHAISGHNNYWLWGPDGCKGELLLLFGGTRESHAEHFASVTPGAVFHCSDCMPYEDGMTIWVARGLRAPLADAWADTKHFD
jgi:hypothetical protein